MQLQKMKAIFVLSSHYVYRILVINVLMMVIDIIPGYSYSLYSQEKTLNATLLN